MLSVRIRKDFFVRMFVDFTRGGVIEANVLVRWKARRRKVAMAKMVPFIVEKLEL